MSVEAGSYGEDVRGFFEACEQGTPVADAIACGAEEFDVGLGADETVLHVTAHAVGDGERDDEGRDAGGDSDDGDGGDEADDAATARGGFALAGTEVAGGDEEFEGQGE